MAFRGGNPTMLPINAKKVTIVKSIDNIPKDVNFVTLDQSALFDSRIQNNDGSFVIRNVGYSELVHFIADNYSPNARVYVAQLNNTNPSRSTWKQS